MTIPQFVRDELDQAPAWWVRLFHSALSAVGAPELVDDAMELRSFDGRVQIVWTSRGYPDCPCSDCRRICS